MYYAFLKNSINKKNLCNKLYSKLNFIEVSTFKLIQSNKPIPFINYLYLFIKGF